MKAPDKIYVREFPEGLNQMWSSIKATETRANAQHEYIRKEALLEWLNNEDKYPSFESCISEEWDGYYAALDNVIDKINSM